VICPCQNHPPPIHWAGGQTRTPTTGMLPNHWAASPRYVPSALLRGMVKKKQHFVPQVYLRSFVDAEPPADWPEDKPFTPGVWIQDPSLTGVPQRRSPGNILWKNSLYTLSVDDPSKPWLEESLGRLETAYGSLVPVLENETDLSDEQYGILLLFVGALFGRAPSQLSHWQDQFDHLKGITRSMSDLPPEGMEWSDFEEVGKRSLESRTAGYAEVVAPYGFVLVNESPMPFITADRPVRHLFLHVDESPVKLFPKDICAKVSPNVEAFFSFAPLGPRLAFIASPLVPHVPALYQQTDDVNLVFSLNQYMRHGAEIIVSHVARPYGNLTGPVIAAERRRKPVPRTGILLYTSSGRHWIQTTQVTHGNGSHPLHGRIRFVAEDKGELRTAAAACELTEVRVYDSGQQVGGLRDAWIASVGIADDEPTVIENWPGGVSAWPGPMVSPDGT
jgi:hypothetical protein